MVFLHGNSRMFLWYHFKISWEKDMQKNTIVGVCQFIYLKLKALNERLILMFIFASQKNKKNNQEK